MGYFAFAAAVEVLIRALFVGWFGKNRIVDRRE